MTTKLECKERRQYNQEIQHHKECGGMGDDFTCNCMYCKWDSGDHCECRDKPIIDLLNDDALDELDTIKSSSVNLTITSPSYNIKDFLGRISSLEEWKVYQRKILYELERITDYHGSICIQVGTFVDKFGSYPLDSFFIEFGHDIGLKLRNRIVWTFNHGLHARNKLSGRYETILWFTKSNDYTFNLDSIRIPQLYPNKKHFSGKKKGQLSCNPLGKNPSDFWVITNVKHNHPEKTKHPQQFPEELVKRLINSLSNERDIVLDPFMGSGTTGKVAKDLNRSFIGIELNNTYYEIAKKRINDLIKCDECKKQVCDDDYDFEYQMCYLCSKILNEKEGYQR
jgi:adenine-specific DNA-methyltransferase